MPTPEFQFEVGLASRYEELLSGEFEQTTSDLQRLLDLVRLKGRLLLSAHAGTGKTSLASQLMTHAIREGVPALRVDLRKWTPSIDSHWQNALDADIRRMSLLLTDLALPAISERRLRAEMHARGDVLVVVDGLNEVPSASARDIPGVLEAFAARNPQASVILCDRLQRRRLPSADWLLATIAHVNSPATQSEIDSALLLDIARGASGSEMNEAHILIRYLCEAGDIGSPALIAEAALKLYADGGRYFPWDRFVMHVGSEPPGRLADSDVLCRDGASAYFRHHLFHDALAAYALTTTPQRWVPKWFDTLTFNANSFDAVGLGLELIESPELADRFLLSVYDWNLYAAAYALGRGRRLGELAVTSSTEEAVLAVLAERRWDPVAPSAQRVEDALRVFPAPLAKRLLDAVDLTAVFEIVGATETDAPHDRWRTVFLGKLGDDATMAELDSGPLIGWIAANALRRNRLNDRQLRKVSRALAAGTPTVRWRAAHVLGAQPTRHSVDRLLRALDKDGWVWVRYGAIRALVEIAGRSDSLRSHVIKSVRSRIPALRGDPIVLAELEKALELREPPRGWASSVEPLVEDLFLRASTVPDQDHWRQVGRRITDSVRSARAGATSA